MLVDTHAHLNFPQFDDDRESAIERAAAAGVTRIVNVGTNLDVSRASLELAARHEGVYATVGFHPHDVADATDDALESMTSLFGHELAVAVGETGLDFYRDYAPRDVQERVFRYHIQFAVHYKMPLVIHSRGAEAEVLALLDEENASSAGGVLHCFGGSVTEARRAVKLGFHLGFGGSLTFKKSDALEVALSVPREWLLLETDCPYLAPVPHRGRRNEPAFVRDIASFLSERTAESLEDIAIETSANASRVFGFAA